MTRARNKLHVSKLAEFTAWAGSIGWEPQPQKSEFEAWRACRGSVTAIIHKRIANNTGSPLTHLTTWGESERLRQQWMKERIER